MALSSANQYEMLRKLRVKWENSVLILFIKYITVFFSSAYGYIHDIGTLFVLLDGFFLKFTQTNINLFQAGVAARGPLV